jgi:glycosyltransferase involved in cell wall biosynthesis
MKILHILKCYYPSQAGGPANTLYWINEALKSTNFLLKIISTKFGLSYSIDVKEYNKNHKAFFYNTNGIKFIKKSCQELKSSDIIQFSSLFFPPTLPILIVALFMKKVVIISPRGELYPAPLSRGFLKKKIWINIVKLFQTKIYFHATNNFEYVLIEETFPHSRGISVIPNFVEMQPRHNFDVSMNFVFVGRINPIKNIDLLISAIAEVQEEYPTITLDIIGAPRLDYEIAYLSELKLLIKEKGLNAVVCFKGHLDGSLKHEIIASSKALILPSKSENFGNVVLEALAQGTPVIASHGTPWELLQLNNAGFWVESKNDKIVKSLKAILSLNESDYNEMRENAYSLCLSEFDIKTNINIWENYYKKIQSNAKG